MDVELIAITPDSQKVIERAGRTCYLSFEKEGPGSDERLIKQLINSGHLSVLEHAYATFRIRGCSRTFTHQLVRHRLCAFSQQSQRYVNEANFQFVEPTSIQSNPEAHDLFLRVMEVCRESYKRLYELGIRKEDARYVLPNATQSEIVVSANFRQFRHMIEERCSLRAQWEIREVMLQILRILQQAAPAVFADFKIDEERRIAYRITPAMPV
ncbi:MAG: FAD-dependent thymidylate synthase [Chloroflexi bacterium]|nr:FAD-dependent thymidylate synthase [Chloroflexota bacterium]